MTSEALGTLLIVEDEPEIRKLIGMYAESIGFEVLEAQDGQAGLDILKTRPVDLIVSDMKMPRMDGMTFLKELRDSGDQTPFLFLSAFTSKEYTARALSLGAFDYLEKPFLPNELKALLFEMSRVSKALGGAVATAGLTTIKSSVASEEVDILRIGSLRGDKEPSIVDRAATGGVNPNLRLLDMFINEAQNQLEHGLRALTDLQHTDNPGWQIGYLFRLMYSIRTTAASLNLRDIQELSQLLEQAYVLLRVRTSYLNKPTLANLKTAHELLRRHLDSVGKEALNLSRSEDIVRLREETKQIMQDLKLQLKGF